MQVAKVPVLTAGFFIGGKRYRKGTPLADLPEQVREHLPKRYSKEAQAASTLPQQAPRPIGVEIDPSVNKHAFSLEGAGAALLAARQKLADEAEAEARAAAENANTGAQQSAQSAAAGSVEPAQPVRTRRSN